MPAANPALVRLLDMMGGRQATANAINAVQQIIGDDVEPVSLRQVNGWVYAYSPPPIARFYLLAAASYLGIEQGRAIDAFGELKPAAEICSRIASSQPAA